MLWNSVSLYTTRWKYSAFDCLIRSLCIATCILSFEIAPQANKPNLHFLCNVQRYSRSAYFRLNAQHNNLLVHEIYLVQWIRRNSFIRTARHTQELNMQNERKIDRRFLLKNMRIKWCALPVQCKTSISNAVRDRCKVFSSRVDTLAHLSFNTRFYCNK